MDNLTDDSILYLEARFIVDKNNLNRVTDSISDILMPLSLSIEDVDLNAPDEQPIFLEPTADAGLSRDLPSVAWPFNWVTLLFLKPTPAESTLSIPIEEQKILTQQAFLNGLVAIFQELSMSLPEIHWRWMGDEDWVSLTKNQFTPLLIGERLWVAPRWFSEPKIGEAGYGRTVLWVDPGLAFGTGSHPTTQLCLECLERIPLTDANVLDYGCGSGILGIAALKFGAKQVIGVDLDEQAIVVAKDNAHYNAIPDANNEEIFGGAIWLNTRDYQQKYSKNLHDVLIANILTNPLKDLAPYFSTYVKQGGKILLSGILSRQEQEVCDVYRSCGFDLSPVKHQDGWVVLQGTKCR